MANAIPTHAQEFVPGEVIVKFRKSASVQSFNSKSASVLGMKYRGGWAGINLHFYSAGASIQSQGGSGTAGATVQELIAELQKSPDVEYVEPNFIIKKSEVDAGPSMTKSELIEAGEVQGQSGTMSLTRASINAEGAWAALSGTATPVVAIIDSGVDLDHEALADSIWTNSAEVAGNGVDDDNNGYIDDTRGWDFVQNDNDPSDVDGHGTHVAGIVRGTTEDLFNLSTAKVRLMPVRFLDNTGSGSTSNAIKAIYYAVNNGAVILNNSWGGSSYSKALLEAIAYSYQQHTLFVAAAGNSSQNFDSLPMYPAAYAVPNVLSVAATTDADALAWFSNFGTTVHIASPGQSIMSSYPNDQYRSMSGTSMSTPFVAGIAALIAREKPGMWGYQIREIILGTGDYKSGLTNKVYTSSRVNVLSSVTQAQGATISSTQPAYQIAVSSSDREVASEMAGGGCGRVTKMGGKMDGGGGHLDLALLLLLSLPILIYLTRPQREHRRKHERFQMESTVKMKIGNQVFEGKVNTISMGGAGIQAPIELAEGSIMTMAIQSPDGKEHISVQGKIVWSAEAQNYGISFSQVEDQAQQALQRWTSTLAKSRN